MTQQTKRDKWLARLAVGLHVAIACQFFGYAHWDYLASGAVDARLIVGGFGYLLAATNLYQTFVLLQMNASSLEHIQHLNHTLEETFRAASRKQE